MSKINRNMYKPPVSESVKQILRRNFTNEIEFYNFCKQRLHMQYAAFIQNKDARWIYSYEREGALRIWVIGRIITQSNLGTHTGTVSSNVVLESIVGVWWHYEDDDVGSLQVVIFVVVIQGTSSAVELSNNQRRLRIYIWEDESRVVCGWLIVPWQW